VYINVILVNHATGAVVSRYPTVTSFTAEAQKTIAVSTNQNNWTAEEGLYTVSFRLYDSRDNEQNRVYGPAPINVGRAEEFVSAFPNTIDLGVIPYGRYMYPNPIKIHWSFYLKNRIRKDYPWYMRIYTDNSSRYKGIEDSVYHSRRTIITSKVAVGSGGEGGPGGLVSSDGKYTLPLRVWCLNYGPDWDEIGWNPNLLGPPPVNDDYVWKGPQMDSGRRNTDGPVWLWIPDYVDMGGDDRSWRKLIGQDPYGSEFSTNNNPTGDFTLDSPFDIYLATETSAATVIGKYTGKLIIEIYTP
jgi:hypothetical protein